MNHNSDYWKSLYKNQNAKTMPWYTKDLDPDLKQELEKKNLTKGTFLDLCTGPGTQAIKLSNLDFIVTGTDISASAIKKVRTLSDTVEFINDSIDVLLYLSSSTLSFIVSLKY